MTLIPPTLDRGHYLRDPVTGIEGIATVLSTSLHNSIQLGIQPLGDGKTYPDPHFVDVARLQYVWDKNGFPADPRDPTVVVKLGQQVEDIVSGFVGMVTDEATHINGCVTMVVTGKDTNLDGKPATIHVPHKRLKYIGPGVTADPATAAHQAQPPERRAGYSNRRVADALS